LIDEIPGWLKNEKPRPTTKRKTFSTARFYDQDSPLVDSGLIGNQYFGSEESGPTSFSQRLPAPG